MPVHGLSTVFRSALAGYLKHLANESAKYGVTVNSVCPASIATPTFMARADAAMYIAKRQGKGSFGMAPPPGSSPAGTPGPDRR